MINAIRNAIRRFLKIDEELATTAQQIDEIRANLQSTQCDLLTLQGALWAAQNS